jgi:hypothetical protein
MRRHGRYGWIDDPELMAEIAKQGLSLKEDLLKPVCHTPVDINIKPEPEGFFLARIDDTVAAFDALMQRIEEDAEICKDLGGDEDGGLIEIEVSEEDWKLLDIHFQYHNGAQPHRQPAKNAFSHEFQSRRGKVRLYRKKTQ